MKQILPLLKHDRETLNEIARALNVGKDVTTHTDVVSIPDRSGFGYIITDPVIGDGVYKISGGMNGAFLVPTGLTVILFAVTLVTFAVTATAGVGVIIVSAIAFMAVAGAALVSAGIALLRGDTEGYSNSMAVVSAAFFSALTILSSLKFLGSLGIASIGLPYTYFANDAITGRHCK